MREIHSDLITESIAKACIEACTQLPEDVYKSLEAARSRETDTTAQGVLDELILNAQIAGSDNVPICQDTGLTVVFVNLGQDVHITGALLADAINEGVRRGYAEGYLRKSIVRHPLDRRNTQDNTPAVIHTDIVSGDELTIWIVPKGGGCENMSTARVLKPSDGIEGVVKFVLDTVESGGPNPCPPLIVGVGLGGTLEQAALLSKKAILRTVGSENPSAIDSDLEKRLFSEVNRIGIGPSGYGGDTTALAVHVASYPCHIASLPVAVTIQCHAARHKVVKL